ncbi:MAG: HD domain-containing phosphohydrolase [Candidatus Eremiobacterota bacterium]
MDQGSAGVEQPTPGQDVVGMEAGQLRLLLEIGRFFNSTLELGQVLDMVIDKVIEVMKAERGCVILSEDGIDFRLTRARGLGKSEIEADDFSVSRNLVRQVFDTSQPVLSNNAMQDPRFKAFGSISLHSIRSIMAAPIIIKGRTVGLIYVDNRIQSGVFKPQNLELLTAIAFQAAPAIENARLYAMKKKIILALANAIEAKDRYTRGHVERVCTYSMAIAVELSLPEADLDDLEICSFLHDVGKIGVSDAVLQKPGKLTDSERLEMMRHSALGESMVLPIDIPHRVKLAIRQHQENYDGSGYPDGLSGESIHLFARIIAVADTWDAMTSDRPYRKRLDREIALAELRRAAGSQLDPDIVEAFLRVLERGEEALPIIQFGSDNTCIVL